MSIVAITNMLKALKVDEIANEEVSIVLGTPTATPSRPSLVPYRMDMRTAIFLTFEKACEDAGNKDLAKHVAEKTRMGAIETGSTATTRVQHHQTTTPHHQANDAFLYSLPHGRRATQL